MLLLNCLLRTLSVMRKSSQRDSVVDLHQGGAQFVQVVLAMICDVFLLTLNSLQRFVSVIRATLRSCPSALQHPQLLLSELVVVWIFNLHAIGERCQRRNPNINPYNLPGCGQWGGIRDYAGETGIPASRFVQDANSFDVAFQRTMPAYCYAPDFVALKSAPIQRSAHAELFEGERVEMLASLKTRVARLLACLDAPKEGLKRLVQISADDLQGLTEDDLRLRECFAIVDARALLFRLAHAGPFQFVAPLALGETLVVPGASNVQYLVHLAFLCKRGGEAILEGFNRQVETPLLDCFLIFNGLLDDGQRRAAHRSDKAGMRPQARQTAFQVGKLLTKQPRTPPFHVLDQLMHPKLGIDFADNVNMIRHDFKSDQFAAKFSGGCLNDFLQTSVYPINQYASSILRAKYHMILHK